MSEQKKTQAEQLIEIIAGAELFHSADGTAHLHTAIGNRLGVHRVDDLDLVLAKVFFDRHGRMPTEKAINDAKRHLTAVALYEGKLRQVFLRVGSLEGRIYLDLAYEDGTVVEIDAEGWRTTREPPVRFYRPNGMKSLGLLARKGSVAELRPFINTASDDDFCLIIGFLVGCFMPTGPYPVLDLNGIQGSAKSTTARILGSLVDPRKALLRSFPRSAQDLMIMAENSWLLNFDNLSWISDAMSDALCQIATGAGFSTRRLYTNSQEVVFDVQRPMILNGIAGCSVRQDLLDRSISIQLHSIPPTKRRTEKEIWTDFDEARSSILGALCDAVSAATRNLEEVRLDSLPRMADFVRWVTAAEDALPWEQGRFARLYARSSEELIISNARENLLVAAILDALADSEDGALGETASEILRKLSARSGAGFRRSQYWPKSPLSLSKQIKRFEPALELMGIQIERRKEANRRVLRIIHPDHVPRDHVKEKMTERAKRRA